MKKIIDYIKKNYILCFSSLTILALFIFVSIFWIKKGTFSIEDDLPVRMTCEDIIGHNKEAICSVHVYSFNETTILSINANYDFDEGIELVSFTTASDDLLELANTENGFAVGKTDGFAKGGIVAQFTIKLADYATEEEYKVGLKNIELSDSEENMLPVDSIESFVRIASTIATLDDITSDNGTLNPTFQSNIYEYNTNVESNIDKVTLNITKTDENSVITGTGAAANLAVHYGTNEFTIVVTAEDNISTNTYKVNVYRKYDFNTQVYKYNRDKNYIYTANDTGDEIKNKLELLPTGLSYNINNNTLEIKYDEELLKSISIINFGLNYEINNGNIYVGNTLNVGTFLNSLSINNDSLSFKLYNNIGEEINITKDDEEHYIAQNHSEDVIDNKYSLEFYYTSDGYTVKLDTYKFVTDYYSINNLVVDENGETIKRIPLGTTYSSIRSKIVTNGTVKFISNDGSLVTNEELPVKTGDIVRIEFNEDTLEYFTSVIGLIDENEVVDFSDVIILYRAFRERSELDKESSFSGDINNDGSIGFDDVILLYRYFRGRINSLEVVE